MNLSLGSRLQLLRGPNFQPNYHSLQAHQTTTPSWAAAPRSPNTTTGSAQTTSEQALPLAACAAAAADDDEVTTTTSPVRKLGMAERQVAQLGPGAACCGWNHCGRRLAAGAIDGFVSIYDSQPSPSSKWQAHQHSIANIVWLPPEYGDAIACVSADGTLSLWEEVAEDGQLPTWRKCKVFEGGNSHILYVQFGLLLSSLKMVTAYSDGQVKVYELLDSLELDKWQLQAEFQNITDPVSRFGKPACISASIAWSPRRSESQQASFAIGFNSDSPNFNSCKIWEFEEAHQRWLPLVDLGSPEDKGDRVHAVAWAPNIGRPYEIIAVATCKGIAIWHISLNLESDGGLSTENVAVLSGHDGEVWQLEWDMGGMTLASTGGDGMVKLWQANLNGVWHEQSVLDCRGLHD